jgi:hypothetical protein
MKKYLIPKWYIIWHSVSTVVGLFAIISTIFVTISSNKSGLLPFFIFMMIILPMPIFYIIAKDESG